MIETQAEYGRLNYTARQAKDAGLTDRQVLMAVLIAAGNDGVTTQALRHMGVSGNIGERIRELRARGVELLHPEPVRHDGRRYVRWTLDGTYGPEWIDRVAGGVHESSDPAVGGDSTDGSTTVQTPSPAPSAPATDSPVDGGGETLFELDDARPSTSHYDVEDAA